ncbi:hypothetical protein NPIL_361471 [Nephila pilipes]|uniref:Uncharacterized protein n=1 Tax=Nephila pilipes TaxID=299642 RepID=A0A8X6PYG7_NEPPI|nr:hypothetical protein NPIL_361471 [Nephila pilipes]
MDFLRRSETVTDIQRRVSRCRDAAFPHEPNFWTRSKKRMLYKMARSVVPTRGGGRIGPSSCAGHIEGNEWEHLNISLNACKRSQWIVACCKRYNDVVAFKRCFLFTTSDCVAFALLIGCITRLFFLSFGGTTRLFKHAFPVDCIRFLTDGRTIFVFSPLPTFPLHIIPLRVSFSCGLQPCFP